MNKFTVILFFGLVAIAACRLVGAPAEVDTDHMHIQRMAKFAVGEIGSEYKLVEVISATKQVVNGMLYNIELIAKRKIMGEKNVKRRCKVLVYEIKHENYLELEEFHCHFTNKQPRL
ncbi:uncharacterized protein LOC123523767 [Mercenaria mercenaria]|uniref:uncharacterized protein LOC123523767 n=1 Tax=Mercenaria mercenaria TaxID=6596 RepID=UPI00234F866A|nr:uncharacterized protein LOC123523767 [Mercenaria mercenaria]